MNYCNVFSATNDCRTKHKALDMDRRTPAEDRSRLYLLSFLLTADRAKAEQCVAAGLELIAEDNAAFRDWAHSWARRTVICDALRLIAPLPETTTQDVDSGRSR